MTHNLIRTALFTSLFAVAATHVQAEILTFEGSTVTGANRILDQAVAGTAGPSLIDYAGYDWSGMVVAKPLVSIGNPRLITGFRDELQEDDDGNFVTVTVPVTTEVQDGFDRSIVSGDTVAFTQAFPGSTFASISARPGDANFDFFSAYLTAGWRDNISVSVIGKRDGVSVYSQALTVGDDGPTLFNFNFLDIDRIEFLASGGTFLYPNGTTVGTYLNPFNAFSSPTLAFDNINIAVTAVPEPEAFAMLLAGLGLMGAVVRRRKLA